MFFPFDSFSIETKLTKEEVCSRLSNFIELDKEHKQGRYKSKSTKKYAGEIDGNTFSFKEILSVRNDFRPEIEGEIYPRKKGADVEIKIHLSFFVLFFMFLWTAALLVFFVNGLINRTEAVGIKHFLPLMMICVAYIIANIIFQNGSKKIRQELRELFL